MNMKKLMLLTCLLLLSCDEPEDPVTFLPQAESAFEDGDYDDALVYYNDHLKANPDDLRAKLGLTYVYMRQFRFVAAMVYADQILDRGASEFQTDGRVAKALLLWRTDDVQGVIDHASAALIADPNYVLFLDRSLDSRVVGHLLALAYMRQADLAMALTTIQTYLDPAFDVNLNAGGATGTILAKLEAYSTSL